MAFSNVPALLAWAFETTAGYAGASSSLGKACSSGGGSGDCGMTALERRAAASQLVAWVSTLPLGERLVMYGLYHDGMAKHTVAFSLVGCVPSTYGIPAAQAAVLRWLDDDLGITKQHLAEKMKRSVRTADTYFNAVSKVLDGLRDEGHRLAGKRYPDMLDKGRPLSYLNKMIDTKRCALAI